MRKGRVIYTFSFLCVRENPPHVRLLYPFLIIFYEALDLFCTINLNYINKFIILHHLQYNNDDVAHDPLHFSLYYIIWYLWTHFYIKYIISPMYWHNVGFGP